MYKYFVVFAAFAYVAAAPPNLVGGSSGKSSESSPVAILSQSSDSSPDGTFNWSFESADGTKAEQTGEVKNLDKDTVVENIHGSFSFADPEGVVHSQKYEANEYGFFPKGSDIFPEIASHLAYLEAHPQPLKEAE